MSAIRVLRIAGRELLELQDNNVTVRGTCHTGLLQSTKGRTGIVFINSLSLPRTATGDSAVYWADCFAAAGYPSFRLDLPGLGDSGGGIPTELLNYINAGEYGSIAAAKVAELVTRFGLSGVVLVGHCAGTVTALYAAAGLPRECKGLVLLDPYFHLPQAIRPMVRRGLSQWAMNSRVGGKLSGVYDRIKKTSLTFRGNALPRNANRKLLHCWKRLTATSVPILLLNAPKRKALGAKSRTGEFDYLSYVLKTAGAGSRIEVKLVEDTDHSFANRTGRAKVGESTVDWLLQHIPPEIEGEAAVFSPDTSAAAFQATHDPNLILGTAEARLEAGT